MGFLLSSKYTNKFWPEYNFNISPVTELQTVSFVENQSYFPPLAAPFSITNDTQITSIMPDPTIEPTILPKDPAIKDNNKVIIMDNSGATSSVARDTTGKNLMYLPPNSNYSMSGNERYVNTGVMIPKGPSHQGHQN